MMAKKIIRVAVVGGSNLKVTDKWIRTVALKLEEMKADEVLVTDMGNGSAIGEKAAAKMEIPNVIMSGQKLVDRSDLCILLPGGAATRQYAKLFSGTNKKVIALEGGE